MWSTGSVVEAPGLSCSAAYEIFQSRDGTRVPGTGRWTLKHWTAWDVLEFAFVLLCNFIYVFTLGCVGSSLLPSFSSSFGAQASHCSGFSCCGPWTLTPKGFSICGPRAVEPDSVVVVRALSHPAQHVGSSQTRNRTHVPSLGRWTLNH